MIEFNNVTEFTLNDPESIKLWIRDVITREKKDVGDINYIFCTDDYLHKINLDFLKHDTLTDIISFDYSQGTLVSGDIYISIERVDDNANEYGVSFETELSRIMVHGILHYCGYKDKSDLEAKEMRSKENYYLNIQ